MAQTGLASLCLPPARTYRLPLRSVPADLQRRAAEAARKEAELAALQQAAAAAAAANYAAAPAAGVPARGPAQASSLRSASPSYAGQPPFDRATAAPTPPLRPEPAPMRPSSSASSSAGSGQSAAFTPMDSPLLDELSSPAEIANRLNALRSQQARETRVSAPARGLPCSCLPERHWIVAGEPLRGLGRVPLTRVRRARRRSKFLAGFRRPPRPRLPQLPPSLLPKPWKRCGGSGRRRCVFGCGSALRRCRGYGPTRSFGFRAGRRLSLFVPFVDIWPTQAYAAASGAPQNDELWRQRAEASEALKSAREAVERERAKRSAAAEAVRMVSA